MMINKMDNDNNIDMEGLFTNTQMEYIKDYQIDLTEYLNMVNDYIKSLLGMNIRSTATTNEVRSEFVVASRKSQNPIIIIERISDSIYHIEINGSHHIEPVSTDISTDNIMRESKINITITATLHDANDNLIFTHNITYVIDNNKDHIFDSILPGIIINPNKYTRRLAAGPKAGTYGGSANM